MNLESLSKQQQKMKKTTTYKINLLPIHSTVTCTHPLDRSVYFDRARGKLAAVVGIRLIVRSIDLKMGNEMSHEKLM